MCRRWGCLLESIPILSLAGRSVHSTKHSEVHLLGLTINFGVENAY